MSSSYVLPKAVYIQLRDKVLETGAATINLTIAPIHFSRVRTFFMNCKNRDKVNKDFLGRYTYHEDAEARTMSIHLEAKPTYVFELEGEMTSHSRTDSLITITEEDLFPSDSSQDGDQ